MLKIKLLTALLLPALSLSSLAQEKAPLWPNNLSTLKSIPSSKDMEKVELNASINADKNKKLTERSFKQLMDTANPLDANDPIIKEWHYAPWYSGSFVVNDQTYYFGLFLSGMGALLTPDKEKGMFTFHPKSDGKK